MKEFNKVAIDMKKKGDIQRVEKHKHKIVVKKHYTNVERVSKKVKYNSIGVIQNCITILLKKANQPNNILRWPRM